MTRFWWVRHGPTHAAGMVGWSDLPADLSDHGAVARLADYLPPDAVVLSSDLRRAVATADALQGPRRRLPHDPQLREMHFGAWELLRAEDLDAAGQARMRAFWANPGEAAAPGGESWNALAARVHAAIDALLRDPPARDIVVVAHFGVTLAALQLATGQPATMLRRTKIEPLSVSETTLGPDGWRHGRINHLP